MKVIDKFVLKAYLGPMLATFFIVMFIMLMNVLWLHIDDLIGKGLPAMAIAKMLFFFTSMMIPMGLPLATLLAAIMTMGNMGENYELLALKAAGVSLLRIVRSILIVALLVSIGSFFIINNYVPYCTKQAGKIFNDIRNQKHEILLSDGIFFNGIPNVSIRVSHQDPDTKKLSDVLIYDNRESGISKTIVADSGYIGISDDKQSLDMVLYTGQMFEDNRNFEWHEKPFLRMTEFSHQNMIITLEGFDFEENDQNIFEGRSDTKNVVELQREIDSISVVSKAATNKFKSDFFKRYLYVSDTTILMEKGDSILDTRKPFIITTETLDTASLITRRLVADRTVDHLQSLRYFTEGGHTRVLVTIIPLYNGMADWHKKWALPVSVLIFFLIGAPLGAIIRRGGLGLPIVISVLFFVFYYIMTMSGEKLVKEGAWPAMYGMWLSSLILAPIAVFLTYKATHDSQLLSIESYINTYKKFKNAFLSNPLIIKIKHTLCRHKKHSN